MLWIEVLSLIFSEGIQVIWLEGKKDNIISSCGFSVRFLTCDTVLFQVFFWIMSLLPLLNIQGFVPWLIKQGFSEQCD